MRQLCFYTSSNDSVLRKIKSYVFVHPAPMKPIRAFLSGVLTFLFLLIAPPGSRAANGDFSLNSPDGRIAVTVTPGNRLSFAIEFDGRQAVAPSALGITLGNDDLGHAAVISGKPEITKINETYPVSGVHDVATNLCKSAVIHLLSGNVPWQLELRIFNDGVAYRYCVPGTGERHVAGESSEWKIPIGSVLWSQPAKNTYYEGRYEPAIVGQLPHNLQIMAPATLELPDHGGFAMMSEANLLDYSDMSLQAAGDGSFKAIFRNDPQGWDCSGEIVSPWRVTLLARDLNALVNTDVIQNLCPPPSDDLAHARWIRPGRSVWHWLTGNSPKLDEQHSWIDGTRKLGYEYYLIDDGWRRWNGGGTNAWTAMAEVVKYARSQGVDIWAWVNAGYVFKPEDRTAYFQNAKKAGLVGLKIDFPKPANREWINWYEDTLREAASMQLMVDFHGAVKPTGRERTWPNEVTREAVAGREQGKNPSTHDTALPFVRYVQGHADYTPTLLIPERLNGSTFAHELSMAIVYTSPFLCMGDNPQHYLDSEAVDVLKALPATWDETRVLPASKIGEIAGFARRKGNQWFIGIINGSTPRREVIALDFLGAGRFDLLQLADNPDRNDAFVSTNRTANSADTLIAPLQRDGGYVAWLVPESSNQH